MIAGRNSLNLGVGEFNNYRHALLLSTGDLYIGGQLDNNHKAIGQANTINNNSAYIEVVGNAVINVDTLNNINKNVVTEIGLVDEEDILEYGFNNDPITRYTPEEIEIRKNYGRGGKTNYWYMVELETGRTTDNFNSYSYKKKTYQTQLVSSDLAKISVGGDLIINANVITNENSQIIAGNSLAVNAMTLNNISVIGEQRIESNGITTNTYKYSKKSKWSGTKHYSNSVNYTYAPADEVSTIDLKNAEISVVNGAKTDNKVEESNRQEIIVDKNNYTEQLNQIVDDNQSLTTSAFDNLNIGQIDLEINGQQQPTVINADNSSINVNQTNTISKPSTESAQQSDKVIEQNNLVDGLSTSNLTNNTNTIDDGNISNGLLVNDVNNQQNNIDSNANINKPVINGDIANQTIKVDSEQDLNKNVILAKKLDRCHLYDISKHQLKLVFC